MSDAPDGMWALVQSWVERVKRPRELRWADVDRNRPPTIGHEADATRRDDSWSYGLALKKVTYRYRSKLDLSACHAFIT